MKVYIHRTRDHTHVEGRAHTTDINEAIARVYNRTLRVKGTGLEEVVTNNTIAERVYEVRMGSWEPRANAYSLGDRLVVSVEP